MIITRTPFRISFFGGGTDYPAWFNNHGGKVIATAIDKYCYISVRKLPPFFDHNYRIVYSNIENVMDIDDIEHPAVREVLKYKKCAEGLEIHHDGDLPARSGLGSSSSFTVGLLNALNALNGEYSGASELAKKAIYIEQELINENVGSQDQISAAFGGINQIEFYRDSTFSVSPVIAKKERLESLSDNLMLFFTGITRFASDIAQSKISNFTRRENELKEICSMVDEGMDILVNENRSIVEFGELLNTAWRHKKGLSNKVSTPKIDDIYSSAISAGAVGGKLLGAGGGGFILFFVEKKHQNKVMEALSPLTYVPFRLDNTGSKVVLYQPEGFV